MLVNVLKALGLVLRYTDLLKQSHLWCRDYLQIPHSYADSLFNEFYHLYLIRINFSGGRGVSVGFVSNTVSSISFRSHMPKRFLLDGQKVLESP